MLPVPLALLMLACAAAFGWLAWSNPGRPRETGDTAAPLPSFVSQPAARRGQAGDTQVPLTVMTLSNELTPAQIAEFEALNPDIRIDFVEFSANLLDILIATNQLPDVFRMLAREHVPLVKRGLLLDLNAHIARSLTIDFDEIARACAGDAEIDGRYYGLPIGFEPHDGSALYVNTTAFAAAGIRVPDSRQPLTYAELHDLILKLSAQLGRPAFYTYFFERTLTTILAQRGTSLFADDFREMRLTQNQKAMEVVRYFYDLALAGAMHVGASLPGIAYLFEAGELPITQFGYWMGAVVTPQTAVYGRATILPPPVWDRALPRVGAFVGSTKLVAAAATPYPDQAYRFLEWYAAGKPALERARRGWGFPTVRSMEALLPRESAFDRQRLQVALDTLSLPTVTLPRYPHPSLLRTFDQSWTKNIGLAIRGRMKFEEFASNLQEDVNLAIQDDIAHEQQQR